MTLYETDFYAWAQEQSRLLRDGVYTQLDAEHLSEEIEGMGRAERRQLMREHVGPTGLEFATMWF